MLSLPDLWTRYRGAFASVHDALLRSLDKAPPASTNAFHALVPYCANEAVPDAGALPLEVHAIACAFVTTPAEIIAFAFAREGLLAAVEVFVCAHEWRSERVGNARHATAATDAWLMTESTVKPALLAADPSAAAACLAYAREKWSSTSPGGKAALSYLFPAERAWSDEVVANAVVESKGRRPGSYGLIFNLVRSVADIASVEKLVIETETIVDLEEVWTRFGSAALPLIVKIVEAPRQSHELKSVARALRHVGTPEVARVFADSIQHAPMRKVATDYFHEFPELAGPLRERAEGTTRAAKFAQEIVSQLTRSETTASDEAPPEALPGVLTSPPWREKKRPTRKRLVVPDLVPLPRKESFELTQLTAEKLGRYRHKQGEELTDTEASAWLAALPADSPLVMTDKATQKRIPLTALLSAWNERAPVEGTNYNLAWVLLAEFGLAVLPGLARWIEDVADSGWVLDPFSAIDSPRLATPIARHLRTPRAAGFAWTWLSLHPETALVGLIPAAVGTTGPRRDAAELALRRLAAKGHGDRARAIAAEYGKSARAAVDEILAWDPLLECPKAAPKLPPLFRPAAFTRPKLADGRSLSVAAVTALGEMLKFTPIDPPYAGLAVVREACEPRSLAELGWDMARAWEIAGGKASEAWMCDALIHLADDEVVRRTTPAIKEARILSVLEKIGTDAAIMELATIAARAASGRNSVYYANASLGEAQLMRIARSKGWTLEELDERVTPTLGMDAEGGLTLDYGPRTVRVGFDESLSPYFQVEGERVRALPVKRKTDDAAKVKVAKQTWDELKEDVFVIADRRIRAMERAMVTGRRWDLPTFRTTWLDHPLMIHLARGVVWRAGDLTSSWTFRVAEDRTFSDENDATFDLARAAWVEIAHPLDLGEERVAKFTRILTDYELIQPFPQLAREAPRLTAAEASANEISRPRAASGAQKLSATLLSTGRWRQEQSRPQFRMRRIFPDEQTYADAVFDDAGGAVSVKFWRGSTQLTAGSVQPVMVAECLRDCEIPRPG